MASEGTSKELEDAPIETNPTWTAVQFRDKTLVVEIWQLSSTKLLKTHTFDTPVNEEKQEELALLLIPEGKGHDPLLFFESVNALLELNKALPSLGYSNAIMYSEVFAGATNLMEYRSRAQMMLNPLFAEPRLQGFEGFLRLLFVNPTFQLFIAIDEMLKITPDVSLQLVFEQEILSKESVSTGSFLEVNKLNVVPSQFLLSHVITGLFPFSFKLDKERQLHDRIKLCVETNDIVSEIKEVNTIYQQPNSLKHGFFTLPKDAVEKIHRALKKYIDVLDL